MFDTRLRPLIDPFLNAIGRRMAAEGIKANTVTIAGLFPALAGAVAISQGHHLAGLGFVLINRLFDGLDGAVARANGSTDLGGYLDALADYVFYIAVPLAFGLESADNLLPALLLVASFTLTCASFLGFAAIAGKRGIETSDHVVKSFYYSTGLAEGTETIAVFVAMCLWPAHFPALAIGFAAFCLLTVVQRSLFARQVFGDPSEKR